MSARTVWHSSRHTLIFARLTKWLFSSWGFQNAQPCGPTTSTQNVRASFRSPRSVFRLTITRNVLSASCIRQCHRLGLVRAGAVPHRNYRTCRPLSPRCAEAVAVVCPLRALGISSAIRAAWTPDYPPPMVLQRVLVHGGGGNCLDRGCGPLQLVSGLGVRVDKEIFSQLLADYKFFEEHMLALARKEGGWLHQMLSERYVNRILLAHVGCGNLLKWSNLKSKDC